MTGEFLRQALGHLVGRVDGPLAFRLILQPVVATVLAIRAGLKDVRAGRPAHAWAILTDSVHRRQLLQETWKDVAKVFVAAVVIDLVYEIVVFRWVYPLQSLIVATILAVLPYLLVRGPVNRIVGPLARVYWQAARRFANRANSCFRRKSLLLHDSER
jgi:hypothetical protein